MHSDETLIRAARGMILHHGYAAEAKAAERAENLEKDSKDAARHWRDVARVVSILRRTSGL